jgi:hypothetical protein
MVKNNKFIETCINLKYRVQNNVLGVEKLKEAQKIKIFKNTLSCAVGKRTTNICVPCVVLRRTTKGLSLPWVLS